MNKNKKFNFENFKEKIVRSKGNYDLYNTKNLLKRYLAWERLIITKKFIDQVDGIKNMALDFGCQRGFLMTYLCSKYHQTIGIDIDKTALKIALGILGKEGFKNFKLIKNDSGNIKLKCLKEKAVDLITCNDVLEHVSDLKGSILEFKRILKNDGYLVVSVPTENLFYKLGNFIDFCLGFSKNFNEETHINNLRIIKRELLNNFELLENKKIFYCFWIALLERK